MEFFYWMVWIVGILICLIVYILHRFKLINKFNWYLYWLGFLLGLCWELPLSIANEFGMYPPARFITPTPLHSTISMVIIIITHSFWDGGLFLVGVGLINLIFKSPYFDKFKVRELGILIIWGQLSELVVEITSSFSGAWEFNEYWWNPVLFVFNNHNITLMPQLIWLAAPIMFYFIALKLKQILFNINE